MKQGLEIWAQRGAWGSSIALHLGQRNPDGSLGVFRSATIERVEEGSDLAEPFLRLTNRDAQHLMDELWHCGLRPTEGTGSAGSLAATQSHLADMREIAKGLLRKSGVEVGK